jgi:hypothetical protein
VVESADNTGVAAFVGQDDLWTKDAFVPCYDAFAKDIYQQMRCKACRGHEKLAENANVLGLKALTAEHLLSVIWQEAHLLEGHTPRLEPAAYH